MKTIEKPAAGKPRAKKKKTDGYPQNTPSEAICQVANLFFNPGEVCELRALGLHGKGPWEGWAKGTVSGYFNDPDKIAAAAKSLDSLERATGIYFCMNPVVPALLARANNRLIVPKNTTTDEQITCQRWFLIDTDPVRPAGISATDTELKTAITCRDEIADLLHEHSLPDPIRAYSGNGGHLLYKLPDLPNTAEIAELKKQSLQALELKFGGNGVGIDLKVFNASRITKLYGTLARKGDSMDDRPHRRSYLEIIPEQIVPVTLEQLKRLGSQAPKKENPVHTRDQSGNGRKLNVEAYLSHYGVEISKIKSEGNRTIYGLKHCLFDPGHTPNEAAIIQMSDGKLLYQCFHNSCEGRTWAEARERISGTDSLTRFSNGYGKSGNRPLECIPPRPPDADHQFDGCSDTDETVEGIPPKKVSLEDLIIDSSQFANIEILEKKPFCFPWLKEQSINLISGWRGCGKTWFVLSLLNCVSQGQPFGPWTCSHAVPCLFLDGEMSVSDVIERTNLIGLHKERENSCFIYSDARANQYGLLRAHLTDMSWRAKMKKILIAKKIKLWAVDNLASLASGLDENCKKDWDPINQWLLELRFAGISTIMLHHMNKDGGQRGTSAREDNLDVSINLKKPHDYNPEDGARFVAHFTKARVTNKNLQKIRDTEFRLIEDESGQYIWTWGDVKKKKRRAVLELINDGIDQKTICETLNLSKGYVSKIKKKLLSDGHISTKGEITQAGFQMLHGL